MSEIGCRNKCHGISGILYLNHGCLVSIRQYNILLHDKHAGALLYGLYGKIVSIRLISADTDKQTSLRNLSGVSHDLRNLCSILTCHAFVVKSL